MMLSFMYRNEDPTTQQANRKEAVLVQISVCYLLPCHVSKSNLLAVVAVGGSETDQVGTPHSFGRRECDSHP